ncbi:MAG TPA: Holliday junction resolvase [Persephonella sp.]|uniref:Holliday junction resolvase Hjc n=1 Tax=Persephonella marina (strain DSM 14350 / EX-H1) TaxID=123214 RepID=C0QSC8_PERMH|nr:MULTISPECIES: Holliday junction DNA helicase [Persephonella]ACO03071.1 holliday junction resolvase Hjc [Persephonella marina EX-H1]HCB69320.1 Holliday junction resolvase [Persephonella sp.]
MKAKAKGSRIEREVKKIFEEYGFEVIRSAGSLGKADLQVKGVGSIQVKARKTFSVLNLFDGADKLVIKANRKEPYIVIPLRIYLEEIKCRNGK